MRAMVCTRSARRLLAIMASAFLLLCQTTALALVHVPVPAAADETALFAPCHDAVTSSRDSDEHAQRHDCPSQYASAGGAKIDAPQAPELPAIGIAARALPAPASAGWVAAAPPARAAPPPLTILHCRLLI